MGLIVGPTRVGRLTHEGDNMEKLGVPLDENKVVTRNGVRHCPKCDAQLPRVGPLNCPNCGTEPFESKEEK